MSAVAHGAWKPATLHIVPAHAWTEIAPGVRILLDAGHDIGMSVQTFYAGPHGCAPDCVHAAANPCSLPGARLCRCDWLGVGTPEHVASALCISLRPDADRDPEPDPCAAGCSNPAMHAEGGHDV